MVDTSFNLMINLKTEHIGTLHIHSKDNEK